MCVCVCVFIQGTCLNSQSIIVGGFNRIVFETYLTLEARKFTLHYN